MASILDVARYLLRKDRYMNPWALHKLCYYAQAWHMVWTGENLFEEDFEESMLAYYGGLYASKRS